MLNKNPWNIVVPAINIEWTFHLKPSFHYVVKFILHQFISLPVTLLLSSFNMPLFSGHNSGLPEL